jgi:hypothetical protein
LFEANRKDHNELQKPFDSWMDIQRYTQVWKELLCYIIQAEDEEADKRSAYKLTGRQQIAVHEVQRVIQELKIGRKSSQLWRPVIRPEKEKKATRRLNS